MLRIVLMFDVTEPCGIFENMNFNTLQLQRLTKCVNSFSAINLTKVWNRRCKERSVQSFFWRPRTPLNRNKTGSKVVLFEQCFQFTTFWPLNFGIAIIHTRSCKIRKGWGNYGNLGTGNTDITSEGSSSEWKDHRPRQQYLVYYVSAFFWPFWRISRR